jgi:hypothetical protein
MSYIIATGNEDRTAMLLNFKFKIFSALFCITCLASGGAVQKDKKAQRLEGEYKIYSSNRELGTEKYMMIATRDAVTSSSVLEFRNPAAGPKRIALESKLEMDEKYLPRSYELKTDVDGERGGIRGQFAPNQVIFEYSGGGKSVRSGLLLGNHFTILDTNVFHHFIFLARLFQYGSGDKPQAFEIVIPQEKETGTLKIRELDKETILIQGKKYNTTRLLVDSGALKIQLWVDGNRIPRKIAVPEKGIEVLHSN